MTNLTNDDRNDPPTLLFRSLPADKPIVCMFTAPPTPFVKVTEIARGQHDEGCEHDTIEDFGARRFYDSKSVCDLLPPEAVGKWEPTSELHVGHEFKAPVGRFRITVEFWPEATK